MRFSKTILALVVTLTLCLGGAGVLSVAVAKAVDTQSLEDANELSANFAGKAGFNGSDTPEAPEVIAGRVIGYVMGFLGVVFFILMIYGGWVWLLARGNDEKVTQAKDTIKNAIIGLLIVFAAYALSAFVVTSILGVASNRPL